MYMYTALSLVVGEENVLTLTMCLRRQCSCLGGKKNTKKIDFKFIRIYTCTLTRHEGSSAFGVHYKCITDIII